MPIAAPEKGRHQLMLVVGEVKDIAPARFGHKIVLKHLPDFPLMAADDLHRRLRKAFGRHAVQVVLEGVEVEQEGGRVHVLLAHARFCGRPMRHGGSPLEMSRAG